MSPLAHVDEVHVEQNGRTDDPMTEASPAEGATSAVAAAPRTGVWHRLRQVRAHASRPAMLIGEQFLYAIANFIVTAILARSLSVEAFAIYASGYALTMMLTLLHQAGVCDALFVFPDLERPRLRRLWERGNAGLVAGSVALAVLAYLFGTKAGLIVAVGFIIFAPVASNQYMRRRNQARGLFGATFFAAVLYALTVCAVTLLMRGLPGWAQMILPQFAGFTAAALGNLAALRFVKANPAPPEERPLPPGFRKSVLSFSLTLAAAATMSWLPPNVYQWLFTLRSNPMEAGIFRVVQTIFVPYFQIVGAVTGPLAQHLNRHGLTRKSKAFIAAVLAMPIAGATFIYLVGSPLIELIFGAKFAGLGPLAAFASVMVMPALVSSLCNTWFRAQYLPSVVVIGNLINLLMLVCIGIPFAASMGLPAVFATIGAGYAAALVAMAAAYAVIRERRRRAHAREAGRTASR
jgi:O-antigen/teichoic acid export membrane protein